MSSPPFDLAKAHRWFAIELNNRAWDLVEKRTPEESAEMIHAAHAAAYHWSKAGTEINAVRALNLLATVYTSACLFEPAWKYAQECADRLHALGDEATLFDRAASIGALGRIASLTNRPVVADAMLAARESVWSGLEPDDRAVLERLYPLGT